MQKLSIWLADPVGGSPQVPPGLDTAKVNQLWTYVGFGVAAIAAFLLAGAVITAMANHQAGRPNDGFGKVGVILGCCFGVGMIGGIVGVITGT